MKYATLCVAIAATLAVSSELGAQTPTGTEAGSSGESVDSLLQRLDDIERRRRLPDADGASVIGSAPPATESTSGGSFGLALWALGVAAAIFGTAIVIRRFRPPQVVEDDGKLIQVQEAMWLGRSQRLLLVRVRGHEVLVGASGGSLSNLVVLPVEKNGQIAAAPSDIRQQAREDDKPSRRSDAERFAHLVQEELTNAAGSGSPLRSKQQILARLNSL